MRPLKIVLGAVEVRPLDGRRGVSAPATFESVPTPGKTPNGVSSRFGIAFGSARSIRTG